MKRIIVLAATLFVTPVCAEDSLEASWKVCVANYEWIEGEGDFETIDVLKKYRWDSDQLTKVCEQIQAKILVRRQEEAGKAYELAEAERQTQIAERDKALIPLLQRALESVK